MSCFLPCENKPSAVQTGIGWVWDPKYHYYLDLTNTVPIWVKPPYLNPKEEAWLDVYLDELLAKGLISPILLGEQLRCVMPLLLVPGN